MRIADQFAIGGFVIPPRKARPRPTPREGSRGRRRPRRCAQRRWNSGVNLQGPRGGADPLIRRDDHVEAEEDGDCPVARSVGGMRESRESGFASADSAVSLRSNTTSAADRRICTPQSAGVPSGDDHVEAEEDGDCPVARSVGGMRESRESGFASADSAVSLRSNTTSAADRRICTPQSAGVPSGDDHVEAEEDGDCPVARSVGGMRESRESGFASADSAVSLRSNTTSAADRRICTPQSAGVPSGDDRVEAEEDGDCRVARSVGGVRESRESGFASADSAVSLRSNAILAADRRIRTPQPARFPSGADP